MNITEFSERNSETEDIVLAAPSETVVKKKKKNRKKDFVE